MSGSMCVEMGLCGGNDGSVEGETGGVEEDCVSVCVWRYRVVERDGCVAVEKGQVCMCVCAELGLVCLERLGCASLCGCTTTGVGCGLTDMGVVVWKTGERVYVLVCAGKLRCVCVGRDGFVCVCVERLGCVCGERAWRFGGRIGGVVEGETGRFGGRFRRGMEGVKGVSVLVCGVIG